MAEQAVLDELLAKEDLEALPFMFSFAKENQRAGTQEAMSDYWTEQYKTTDTD